MNIRNNGFFTRNKSKSNAGFKDKFKNKKKLFIILGIILGIFLVGFLIVNSMVNNATGGEGNLIGSITRKVIPGESPLDGEDDGRINIALLGMRGKGVEGGGTLADTIIIASIRIIENESDKDALPTYKVSMVSIPRDLYVTVPGTNDHQKINAVYHYGEKQGDKGGLELMKTILQDISGQKIHYAMAINFAGFEQIVDALDGVEVTLDEEFIEPIQFHEEKVCDGTKGGVFTVKSGNFQNKIDHNKIIARYPLCYNETEECNGVFKVPAGTQVLDGKNALCYVRARVTSNDFDRARRQQDVIKQLKKKALSVGFLSDFGKISEMMGIVGDNLSFDMELWEMERFFNIYKEMGDPEVVQKVLDNSAEGLLQSHEGDARGYILMPRSGAYDEIRDLFANII